MKISTLLAAAAAAALGLGALGQAAAKAPVTHEAIWMMKRVGAPVVSPDGKWVIYSLTEARDPVHAALLRCVRGCFQEVEILKTDLARRAKVKSPRCCS